MILRRVLIANRGEIALRILRTCRRLGIETVLAASDADLASVPARLADRVVRLGPPPPSASYLDVDAVLAAARTSGADAIHPGYGFLSENQRLAQACAEAGIVFIGPTVEQLAAVGDKLEARRHAIAAGLPVVPGGPLDDAGDAARLAAEIGFPLLVKAVGGGGGRGMKQVHDPAALASTIDLAMAEAGAAFGDPRVYLERFVATGRHVEVQLLADGENVVHLGTRDCSVQRRYQKLIEEAPAPVLDAALREEMHRAAVALGKYLGYRGLGTVEFLVDVDRGTFYFLEMNARIQVEHPVTEAITGLDLVAEQLAVAEGRSLSFGQADVSFSGHAIECRINAEDWARDFQPSPGTVTEAVWPLGDGIRIDTHLQAGATVPPYYDSLLAKLIVHGRDRDEALARLRGALARCAIDGVSTNTALHQAVLTETDFAEGGVDTAWFTRFLRDHPAAGSVSLSSGGGTHG
ncbi:Phosphoribosylglycinamide synthetase, ATP-grasp (A) domain protein [Streptomyces graminofaciens]|uniref:biotin carboxylase n=1 Tax=Streptomyces graminofaciens TaxID=68212 RepID=A0ABN5V9K8_9ACTN|nr:biotin carboxylase N-terminal domain-containing protein [Streptomyces graminofaciens]BBC29664.1 Phosphoribosylglycinamide synthetase, ATP-grasp (A) domain protein [Streptomyces graminofaciens]